MAITNNWINIKSTLTKPAVSKSIATADFIARIPTETWAKISAARQGITPLAVALDQGLAQLCASPIVIADYTPLIAMLTQLVTAGVLTEEEKTQILSF